MYVPTSSIFQAADQSSHFDPDYEPLITGFDCPPSAPVAPAIFTKKWFLNAVPPKPMLPPILQREFPLNLVTCQVQNDRSLPVLTPCVS